jgi:hypothetical protein
MRIQVHLCARHRTRQFFKAVGGAAFGQLVGEILRVIRQLRLDLWAFPLSNLRLGFACLLSLFLGGHFKVATKRIGKLDLPRSLAFRLKQGRTRDNYRDTLRS